MLALNKKQKTKKKKKKETATGLSLRTDIYFGNYSHLMPNSVWLKEKKMAILQTDLLSCLKWRYHG